MQFWFDRLERVPGWDSFASGVAAALELNFLVPADQDDDQADMGIETRAINFAQLVASGEVACEMHPSFGVDPETGMAGYVIPPTLGGDQLT